MGVTDNLNATTRPSVASSFLVGIVHLVQLGPRTAVTELLPLLTSKGPGYVGSQAIPFPGGFASTLLLAQFCSPEILIPKRTD